MGIKTNALTPMHNNNRPKILSPICKRSLITGIIGAHVVIVNPAKKNAHRAAYCSFFPALY